MYDSGPGLVRMDKGFTRQYVTLLSKWDSNSIVVLPWDFKG